MEPWHGHATTCTSRASLVTKAAKGEDTIEHGRATTGPGRAKLLTCAQL